MAETPEQTRLRLLATARQRQAEAEAYAPSDLTPPDNSWSGFAREAIRSPGEGIAGMMDLPEQIVTGVRNLPRRLANAGVTYGGESFTGGVDPAPAPVELLNPENIYTTAYNKSFPVTPGYEKSWTREVGNIAGPTALTLGVGSGPAIVRGVATRGLPALVSGVSGVLGDTALTTAGTVAGKEGGGAAGQYFGGDTGRQWGEALGSLFGGFTTPMLREGIGVYARSGLTDKQSAQRAADAATAGVDRDVSLVGSPTGIAAAKKQPGYADVRKTQQDQIDESLRESARAMARRGDTTPMAPTGPISEPDIGKSVASSATSGAESAVKDANTIFDNMSQAAGRDTPIDHTIVQAKLNELRKQGAAAQPTVDYYQKLLDKDLASGGLTWDRALQHKNTSRPADATVNLDDHVQGLIRDAYNEALRKRAGEVGYGPDEFNAVNEQYGGLVKEKGILKDIGEKKAAPAYDELFSPENAGGENLSLLQQHDPNSLANILSQNFELKTRGSAAGRPSRLPDAKLYPGGPKWWADASEEMRQAYANNPELRAQIDATMNIIRADARRGGGAPIPVSSDPTAAIAGGALALGHPAAAAAAFMPKVASYVASKYYGNKLLDSAFTDDLVQGGVGPRLTPSDLARTIAAYVGAQQ